MLDITNYRARQNYLYDHPEEATPEDIRIMVSDLRAMRECATIIEQRGGGSAAVATLELDNSGSMSVRLTAPAHDIATLERLLRAAVQAVTWAGAEGGEE